MSKDCGNHGDSDFKQTCRRLLIILLGLAVIVGVIALIVYLVLRPTHPRFILQDATLRQLDLSNGSAPILSTAAQVTIASRNPNDRIGVYYDRLDVYASYKYQQVTLASRLPTVYQGHGDVDVWSPVLTGPNVPFAPFLADAMRNDIANGYLMMEVRIDGRVRWKVGSWTSGHYHIFVTCPAYFISSGGYSVVGAHGLRFQTATYCRVEV
ncbi:NDR1/HIN1-like protein 12 [Dichanthelium oligosanthes]|uniref:NDR1/HIN1-like protein 12 n=1 Tax=Dichanthelium oligosanthes TaxID=888268 RepID=A0A1E5V3E1_9POAL|nr:NDR1/HIN1-like protein 12 [Dichanthelium oligosanthes]